MSITERLTTLKNKFEADDREAAKLTGAIEQEGKQLKEEFGLKTMKAANTWLDGSETELDTMDNKLEKGVEELEGMVA